MCESVLWVIHDFGWSPKLFCWGHEFQDYQLNSLEQDWIGSKFWPTKFLVIQWIKRNSLGEICDLQEIHVSAEVYFNERWLKSYWPSPTGWSVGVAGSGCAAGDTSTGRGTLSISWNCPTKPSGSPRPPAGPRRSPRSPGGASGLGLWRVIKFSH